IDFATWLLHADVREAYPLNVELPGGMLTADQVFYVTLANGRALVLHIEFQGRISHQPRQWRMLEYMARLGYTHRLALWSVVLYVGHGANSISNALASLRLAISNPSVNQQWLSHHDRWRQVVQ